IPIVITTVTDRKEKGIALGVPEYLVKPFKMEQLLRAVQRVLGSGRGQRILVADDDHDFRALMVQALVKGGFQPVEAQDGEGALARLKESVPSLMILDILMPGMNGLEVLGRLRSEKDTMKMPVL